MIGVGSIFAMLMLGATPALPGTGGAEVRIKLRGKAEAPGAMQGAVSLAAKWGAVTSVYRSPSHNRAVGGAPNSWHLQGRAIDIARRPGVAHAQLDAAFRRAGYVLIESLDEGDHSHFAFGLPGSAPRPSLSPLLRMAAAAPPPACPVTDPAVLGRRRPGAEDVCLNEAASEAKYKPIALAP
ncbi:MAG TPA: D-Ala-D-Ala carboxypeptidase family metallohydrolase [Allosphingosinicella sp.]|jgi:hypothetical protein|uniref:D-Ala-D-Ala carboxypeptidase family metallohydrolase n=1 Tax=Allosphingosinicella sp. TaxID=2823234 RepID=UPI002F2777B0